MIRFRSAGQVAVLGMLAACKEYELDARETGDLGYSGPYGIELVERSCTPGQADTWHVGVRTEGWAHAVDLIVLEPPTASETHPMGNVDYDPAGEWDEWEVTLLQVADSTDAQAGATTVWGCDDTPNLAWQVVMYTAEAPDVPADCAVWGPAASLALSGPGGLRCTCVEEDGDCTD